MAEQKKTPGKKGPMDTSSVDTSLFNKGMVKDMNASFQGEHVWSHARNAYNNSHDGDVGVIGNEPSNFSCAQIDYTIIGAIHLYADKWVIFSTNDSSSEIGLFDDSKCEYDKIVNDGISGGCLGFKRSNLIKGASKENFDCTWQVYWDDGLNPSRTLNLDNVPWIQVCTTDADGCVTCVDLKTIDCEKFRLAPLLDTPCIKLSKAEDGGQLRNGGYQAFIAYTVNEQKIGDYIGISNFQSLFSHNDTSGALILDISNLDKEFEFYELVIVSNNQQEIQAKKLGLYSTEQTRVHLDYINQKLETIPIEHIPLRNPAYEKSDSMYVVNDWLIRSGPTEQFDFNYQPLANEIITEWISAEYPADYYYNGGNKPTFLRDEVYAFFIRWIYNTGERSSSYHIPGRQTDVLKTEIALTSGPNNIESDPEFYFNIYNTADEQGSASEPTDDGGIVTNKGIMAYWQSTEKYPAAQPEIWGDLCGKPIRHHKFPDESVHPSTALTSSDGVNIRILGVEFRNIQIPMDSGDPAIPISNVVGYEILRGSREGNKSILAKGIIKNMREYDVPGGQETEEGGNHQHFDPQTGTWINQSSGGIQGLYPNFPYNDLGADQYHTVNIAQGCGNEKDLPLLSDVSHKVFTFHSPDLMFRIPHLNPYECKLYSAYSGKSTGHFIPSEDHPKHKLLKNGGVLLAIIVGAGYAMAKFRGKRVQHYKNAVPSSIGFTGVSGGPVSVQSAPLWNFSSFPSNAASVGFQTGIVVLSKVLLDLILEGFHFGADVFTGGTASEILRYTGFRAETAAMEIGSPGYSGGTIDESVESSDWSELPKVFKVWQAIYNFILFTTEGGQEVIDLIYNFVSERQFAYKYNSHGFYQKQFPVIQIGTGAQLFRTRVDNSAYLNSTYQSFGSGYKINNLFRPKTVVIENVKHFEDIGLSDNSRFTLGNITNWEDPGTFIKRNISAYYAGLKFSFQNQYGQLDGIRQIPIKGCVLDAPNLGQPVSSGHIFGGDCYINRYTEKTIMPIFWDFLREQPDNFPFDYLGHVNIPYPKYWMNTEKYHLANMVSGLFGGLKKATDVSGWDKDRLTDELPNDRFYLDWDGVEECAGGKWQLKKNGKKNYSLFNVTYGYIYTHVSGINDFFVESEINLAQRDWEEEKGKRHFDWQEYGEYDELFHSEIIKKGNFYKYDYSLSTSRFWSNLISFGTVQPKDYDPIIAETCFSYYPKRLIYSLQAQKEAKKDFWRVFLPQNYKDFKSKVNVIKPVNKSGALVLFPYLSPQMFQGVDQLETDMGTKLTIGDGGLFNQPFQNIVNSDLSNEHGSCESERSVINTPSGLFYISQAQGKVFHYTGQGLENIANRGMKWWFNKYLPSELIKQYPLLEGNPLGDNPVVGVGCQSIYDPNDNIVYFCKKDYKVKGKFSDGSWGNGEVLFDPISGFCFIPNIVSEPPLPEPDDPDETGKGPDGLPDLPDPPLVTCIPIKLGDPKYFDDLSWTVSYDPKASAWISFHDWHPELCLPSINHFMTTKWRKSDRPGCPAGYKFNWDTGLCELIYEETLPAIVQVAELQPIIVEPETICTEESFGFDQEEGDDPADLISTWTRFCFQRNSNEQHIGPGWSGEYIPTGLYPDGTIVGVTIDPNALDTGYGPGLIYTDPGELVTNKPSQLNFKIINKGSGYIDPTGNPYGILIDVPTDGSISGSLGVGLTVNILNINISGEVTKARINKPGQGYTVGDIISIVQVGGGSDATIEVELTTEYYFDLARSTEQSLSGHEYLGSFEENSPCMLNLDGSTQGPMTEGANIGPLNRQGFITNASNDPFNIQLDDGSLPCCVNSKAPFNHACYYFNRDIQKFVYVISPEGKLQSTTMEWVTFFPTVNVGQAEGNPTATQTLSTNDNWSITGLTSNQFTIDAANPSAVVIPAAFPGLFNIPVMIQCAFNSIVYNGFYSVCSFKDYTHEVTLGSTAKDNDSIGIVLAAFKDVDGEFGPVNRTHTLVLDFTMNFKNEDCFFYSGDIFSSSSRIMYNIGQDVYAFTNYEDSTLPVCPLPGTQYTGPSGTNPLPPSEVTSELIRSCYNPFYNTPGVLPVASKADYDVRGYVRVKIKKTGSRIQIWATRSMGDKSGLQNGAAVDVGAVNPYTSFVDDSETGGNNDKAVLFDFDLEDPCKDYMFDAGIGSSRQYSTPWDITNSDTVSPPPPNTFKDYVGDTQKNDVLKVFRNFSDNARIGYFTMSQPLTQFFHIKFTGDQVGSGSCECPDGFTKVYKNDSSPFFFTESEGSCTEGEVICREVKCICPPATYPGSVLTKTGECDDVYNAWSEGGTADPAYVNTDPELCNFVFTDVVLPIDELGSIWKHNYRCDSFGNYYDTQYPWEIELIESTGQAVNTLRSIEYQLESYLYKGNLDWDCGDRWHDLNWNFDEAIIYNTEQVSGLLKLKLNPQSDPITALQYPIISPTDIQILYTKEEQKYRFNQFWDITKDRGEFTSVEEQIFITQLNGYIKDLNKVNLDYNKAPTQRKKFRHYYNKVLLRSIDSEGRKMLLKLVNTKLNYSFR